MDYCETLSDAVVRPLMKHGAEGVDAAVEAMNSYDLLREDLEALLELSSWPGSKNPMSTVESKVRSFILDHYLHISYCVPACTQVNCYPS